MTSWIDPMTENKTAGSDIAFQRMMRDYPHDKQVEAADDFGRFAAALTALGFLTVLGYFLVVPILRKIFG